MLRALDLTNIQEVDLSIDDVQLMDVFERLTERRCEVLGMTLMTLWTLLNAKSSWH